MNVYPFYILDCNRLFGGGVHVLLDVRCLNGLQLLHLPDINPTQPPAKGKRGYADSDTEIHDMANCRGIALQRSRELIARNKTSDGTESGTDDDVRADANLANMLLELFAQTVGEDGIGGNEKDGTAHVLTKDDDSHGNRDLQGRDKILDSYIGLQAEVKLANTDSGYRGYRILGK